jgi:hypothetical protein
VVTVLAEVWLAEATAIVRVIDVGSEVRACFAFLRFADALAAVSVVDSSKTV